MDSIYIIIVTYNGMKWLRKCLTSTKPYPVIVIDNYSTDNTVEYIKRNYPKVKLLKQKENLGFGQANNVGISYALEHGAKYVFLLNQDVYLEPGCIEKLVATQRKTPEYGLLSPLHLNGQGNKLDHYFSIYINYEANPDIYSDYILNRPKKAIYSVPFINAAGWLISKKCLETVGGFDPIFFHYGEDENYCQRVHYHGFKIGVCPEAKLKHDREARKAKKIQPGSSEYFDNIAKSLKSKFANINKSYKGELLEMAEKRKIAFRKSLFKLNFEKARYYNREVKMLKKVHVEIIKSRSVILKKGLHYLHLKVDS